MVAKINLPPKELRLNWTITIIVIVLALIGLIASFYLREHTLAHDLTRDIGIALLIAVGVGFTYETFARSHFIRETMEAMLGVIFGDVVRGDVWDEVKDHILRKEMLREKLCVRLEVKPEFGPPPNPSVLWMLFSYDLKGIHSRPKKKPVNLKHFLDDHITRDNYPHFVFIFIDSIEQSLAGVARGEFNATVDLDHKEGAPLHVIVERNELTYVPGSYNLTMTEMTKGIELILVGLPSNMDAAVNILPYVNNMPLIRGVPLKFKDMILLPGQTIVFRFKRKSD